MRHDPRNELHKNITSGELSWIESLKTTDNDNANYDVADIEGNLAVKLDVNKSIPTTGETENYSKKDGVQTRSDEGKNTPTNFLEREIYFLSQPHGLDNESEVNRAMMAKLLNYVNEDHQEDSLSSLNTALYFLGIFYYYGLGDLKDSDPEKAIYWFQKAAENGHSDSQCVLGLILYFGIKGKVGKDRKSAMRWFYRASQDGDHPRGHWLLGKVIFEGMYYDDIGLTNVEESNQKRNFIEASRLFQKASEHNIPEAMHQLAIMYEYGLLDSKIDSNDKMKQRDRFGLAVEYYEKAASLELVESLYHLGLMFTYGRGVALSYTIAADYFRRGAMKKHSPSMRYLAIFALNGYDQPHEKSNPKLAMKWLEMCIEHSNDRLEILRQCTSELNEAKVVLSKIKEHKIRTIQRNSHNRTAASFDKKTGDRIQYQ